MRRCVLLLVTGLIASVGIASGQSQGVLLDFDKAPADGEFRLADGHEAAPIYVSTQNPETVRVVANAFAGDVEMVTGTRPAMLSSLSGVHLREVVIAGVIGQSPEIDALRKSRALDTKAVEGKWESAVTSVVPHPAPGVERALVIAGSDRRGVAFALFTLSRKIGVSPWGWWADVPVKRHTAVYVRDGIDLQHEPSVKYRGIFLNDEDWGLRPWAAKKMDPELGNIGPHTYARIFELLLRLRANSLWPAMHPGTLAFNAVPENAKLADQWGIVMGSSHSEALLRNNVGEWDEKRDGPWNYQVNRPAIDAYWEKRVRENGKYQNFYTVGMRGVHDTGLEATGSVEVKARLVEEAMKTQRALLAKYVNADVAAVPQVIWLYKESLELYRAGMKVPDDVTLGWTDDNYGYLRQLPSVEEQKRAGGSGVYYHVSYWGFPHDYLWLCSTPPALIREEMTKAYDHQARRYWILNVGDLKPAEIDIDYFMQLAWDEPAMAAVDQKTFLQRWFAEQFAGEESAGMAGILDHYYRLNFVRKPEFLGFNGYDDGVRRTDFNPLAWGDQNRSRATEWHTLQLETQTLAKLVPAEDRDAFFELVGYPVEAAAEQNAKFLFTDRSYLDAAEHRATLRADAAAAHTAYDRIQTLTAEYNHLHDGKWDGMMSAHPRDRHVFDPPVTATAADANQPLPASWGAGSAAPDAVKGATGFVEEYGTVSINAAHFTAKHDGSLAQWQVMPELGISGGSVEYGAPGKLASQPPAAAGDAPWLEYRFTTASAGPATLALHLLPTFALDSDHRLRYAVALDGKPAFEEDASGSGEWKENSAPTWTANVLRNSAEATINLGPLAPGPHTIRLLYRDPGVVFEYLVVTFAGAPPAYEVAPETVKP